VKKLVDTAHQEAERLIREHMNDMRNLAEALLKYETLTAEEVEKVLAGEILPRIQAVQPVPATEPVAKDGNGQIR
jgi:cell division protease FtsH